MKFNELVERITNSVDFYSDTHNKEALFAEFYNGAGIKCFARLESMEFKAFLCMKALEITNGKQSINEDAAVHYIRKHFTYYGYPPKTDVFIRTAGDLENGIEYDLKDTKQRSVIITKNGWGIAKRKKHKFLSSATSMPQVRPKRTEENPLDLLKPFINLKGNDYILFVVWLIQAFCSGNHSALLVSAKRGCGKSSLSRAIRQIISPSEVGISQLSNNRQDFICTLSNLYLVCYDNVRDISKEYSDILCQAITGATVTGRTLYTNNDLYVQQLHNAVVINGISVAPSESDLAERFIIITPNTISKKARKREKDLWKSFDETLPYIMGAIFETLHKAMNNIDKISMDNLPRMADAFVDMTAIALALGISEDEFRTIYDENVAKMNKLRSETPLVEAIREAMNDPLINRRSLEGKAEYVYSIVKSRYSGDKRNLPGSASQFSRKLEAEHDVLYAAGYRINIDDTHSDGTEIQIIRRKK